MITIHNLRHRKCDKQWCVAIDRRSVLGNPFFMKSEKERDKVCDDYEKHFNKMKDEARFKQELRRLYSIHKCFGKLELYCWCAPKRCHGETIKKFLEQYI